VLARQSEQQMVKSVMLVEAEEQPPLGTTQRSMQS
jgi:hypothetical protein